MNETVEVKLARIEEGMVAMRGELKMYHEHISGPMAKKVDKHQMDLALLKRDRWWISSMVGIASSWLGLKLFGKG